MKLDTKVMESSLKDEIEASGSLLNNAKAKPLSVMAKALHLKGSGIHAASSDSYRC